MIPLSTHGKPNHVRDLIIGRVSRAPVANNREDYVLLLDQQAYEADIDGYAAVLSERPLSVAFATPLVYDVPTSHLSPGDVVSINSRGHVRTLYRPGSRSNALFVTDRCNSYCLM